MPPADIAELARPRYAAEFVTENPETSPPGMGFLLATIARFGEEGWEDYWQELADNGVTVTSGWTEAYFGEFVAGGGDRAIVMSYASSPVAEVLFADPPVDVPPTAVLLDSCFRSIEFAGVLNGTENPGAAARLVDFLLSPTFQEDIPINMFVYPANDLAQLPEVFTQWGPLSDNPLTLPPDQIQANRDRWTQRWTEIVLRCQPRHCLWFTLWQAAVSTLVTLVAGLPIAHAVARFSFRGRHLLRAGVTVPFVLPTVVVGAAFLSLSDALGLHWHYPGQVCGSEEMRTWALVPPLSTAKFPSSPVGRS